MPATLTLKVASPTRATREGLNVTPTKCLEKRQRNLSMPKRKAGAVAEHVSSHTKRSRVNAAEDGGRAEEGDEPTLPRSILRNTPSKPKANSRTEETPRSIRKVLFSTGERGIDENHSDEDDNTTDANNLSARRKSQRTLHQRLTANDDESDQEEDLQEAEIAEKVLNDGDSDEEADLEEPDTVATTPTKSGRPRGRPKGRKRERTPSPPPDLPPHELYFFQNRTGGNKTSANTIPPHTLLNHDDYFARIDTFKDPHDRDMGQLSQLHARAFDQWIFELREGFNVCLYGYGSKRALALRFAEHAYQQSAKPPKIIVINGYSPGLTLRDILTTVANSVLPKTARIPAQPAAMLEHILTNLTASPPKTSTILIINSLDHSNLRKPSTQSALSRLASHPSLSLLATCDSPNFPLLWDVTLSSHFRFAHHDATTFAPYTTETTPVDDVNVLLGRSGRRLGGKDGVAFVLKSLPENARSLFRTLVAEQLSQGDIDGELAAGLPGAAGFDEDSDVEEGDILGVEDEDAAMRQETPSRRGRGRPPKKQTPKKKAPSAATANAPAVGVEYRTLYHKAVEDFICSSEVNFRTLLKEFHDHQMIESRKDALGTERLIVPFRREELEAILEELV